VRWRLSTRFVSAERHSCLASPDSARPPRGGRSQCRMRAEYPPMSRYIQVTSRGLRGGMAAYSCFA
jgi:hypothetical protein